MTSDNGGGDGSDGGFLLSDKKDGENDKDFLNGNQMDFHSNGVGDGLFGGGDVMVK